MNDSDQTSDASAEATKKKEKGCGIVIAIPILIGIIILCWWFVPKRGDLRKAVEKKNLALLEQIFQQGVDPDLIVAWPSGTNPRKALHIACDNGFLKGVEALLKSGASPDGMSPAPLALAARKAENKDIIKLLIKNGAKLDCNAIYYAAQNGNIEGVKLLLEAGAKANRYFGSQSNTTVADLYGHPEIVDLLIEHGASPPWNPKNWKPHQQWKNEKSSGKQNLKPDRI